MTYSSSPEQIAARPTRPFPNRSHAERPAIMLYNEQYAVVNPTGGFVSYTQTQVGPDLRNLILDARLDFIQGIIDETAFHEITQQWLRMGGALVIEEMNMLYDAAQRGETLVIP
jgi:hypothetical protein